MALDFSGGGRHILILLASLGPPARRAACSETWRV
jgi:hypothetical protein